MPLPLVAILQVIADASTDLPENEESKCLVERREAKRAGQDGNAKRPDRLLPISRVCANIASCEGGHGRQSDGDSSGSDEGAVAWPGISSSGRGRPGLGGAADSRGC